MSQIANVVFAYSPKNDDELELVVGDKIEVIGLEQEGWWKGILKGRTGVFPSNFVQVIESTGPNPQTLNKLNSPFGSLVNTKNSLSSNSLNTINNQTSNFANNNNSTSNGNLIMNNAQQNEVGSSNECNISSSTEDSNSFHKTNNNGSNNPSMHSERRPKPLRGIGYGDIFAAGAKVRPLPADPSSVTTSFKPSAMASERLSTTGLPGTLQKPIPKKPPPPAPVNAGGLNGSPSDQAPALPPKPSNHFNPFMPHPTRPNLLGQQRTVVDRVEVIYAYKPSNSDELEMEVGDIIDVLEKNIEDQGWWRGELKGKIGVFPDNFVRSISMPQQQQQQQQQHQSQQEGSTHPAMPSSISHTGSTLTMTSDSSPPRQNGYSNNTSSSPLESTSPGKLYHITASRAKGPTRRPPKNILNKRNLLNESSSSNESKREQSKLEDEAAATCTASLIAFDQTKSPTNQNTVSMPQNVMYSDNLPSLPGPVDHQSAQQPQQQTQHNVPAQVKSKLVPSNIQAAPQLTPTSITPTTNSTPPPWMVELKKTNAERKRDPVPVSASMTATPVATPSVTEVRNEVAGPSVVEMAKPSSPPVPSVNEFNELKAKVEELNSKVDRMELELKANQSATESMRKYIKDLVSNLADERKRIAAMQVEIDRNLK